MKTKQDFRIATKIVSESIHRIDPYSLLSEGSPTDEFDSEINSIVGQLHRCSSGNDVSHAIARVLSSSFGEKYDPKEFEVEGQNIYNTLLAKGLV